MKPLKKYFVKRRNQHLSELSLTRSYPKSFNKIGIISNSEFEPDTNFITKLKNGFGDNIQISIFVINGKPNNKVDFFRISLDEFKLFGEFRNKSLIDNIKQLDLLIDMTLTRAIEKLFVLNHSTKAYKICLGIGFCDNCNLTINFETLDQDLFADEIIKYHNIFRK